MAIIIVEKFDSREATIGIDSPSFDLLYAVIATDVDAENDAAVRAVVEATIPAFIADLQFQSYHVKHQGGGVWEATARYGKKPVKKPGDSQYSFDTGGGTTKKTQSIRTVASYAPPDADGNPQDAPDYKGAIGVNNDTVEGVDVEVPVFHFKEIHYIPIDLITPAYKVALFYLTGTVNDAPFKGFARGEVKFLGASGSQRGQDDWEITYSFAASPNAANLSVGDITGIAKEGWHYLWVRYEDAVDENVLVKQPSAAYVEQVSEYGDFSQLGIGV
jgi:hypothetical protein